MADSKLSYEQLENRIIELEKFAEIYKLIADNTIDCEIVRDINHKIIYVSPSFEKLFGYTTEDYLNGKLSEKKFIHPDDINSLNKTLEKVYNDKSSISNLELRTIKKDKKEAYISVNILPIFDKKGIFIGTRARIQNISKRQEIKDVTNQKNNSLAILNDFAKELAYKPSQFVDSFIVNKLKEYTGAIAIALSYYEEKTSELVTSETSLNNEENSNIKKILGKKITGLRNKVSPDEYTEIVEQIIGTPQSLYEVTFGSIPKFIADSIQKIMGVKHFVGMALMKEHQLVGALVIATNSQSTIPDADFLKAFSILCANAIERKRAELAYNKSEAKFKVLSDNSYDIMTVLNPDGIIEYESSATYRILGYIAGERIGKNAFEFVHPDDLAIVSSEFQKLFSNPNIPRTIEFRFLGKNNSWVWLEGSAQNFLSNPFIEGIIINSRDINDRKKTEQALKAKETELIAINAAKDKLFSIIAHDLRSPFCSMIGMLELLCDNIDTYDLNKSKNFLNRTYSLAENTLNLLDNLLSWAKSQIGQIQFSPEEIDLSTFINQTLDIYKSVANVKNIRIQFEEIQEPIMVIADPNMLKIIFQNLVANAIKFTNTGGKIEINTLLKQNFAEISVSDNGIGMSEEVKSKIFQPGEQITMPGTANEKGTGLGLVLCKEFVERNSGKIWVNSKMGKGSSFTFSLPVLKNNL